MCVEYAAREVLDTSGLDWGGSEEASCLITLTV